ncbi:MAG: hypothetical protein RIT27_2462 [Pseudomonadota bacterium]|jgi:hypothetical protein
MKSILFVASLLSFSLAQPVVLAEETPSKPIAKEKTGELQKRCAENPKLCQEQKAQRKQKQDVRKAWCAKHATACEELKPIQAQPPSPTKRQARQAWCKKHSAACAELKQINQNVPQSKQ